MQTTLQQLFALLFKPEIIFITWACTAFLLPVAEPYKFRWTLAIEEKTVAGPLRAITLNEDGSNNEVTSASVFVYSPQQDDVYDWGYAQQYHPALFQQLVELKKHLQADTPVKAYLLQSNTGIEQLWKLDSDRGTLFSADKAMLKKEMQEGHDEFRRQNLAIILIWVALLLPQIIYVIAKIITKSKTRTKPEPT